jgi:hypothetical protein
LPLLKKVIMDRFGDEVAITASSDGNVGSFEVTAAQTGTTPWPPPPVKYPKKYESAVDIIKEWAETRVLKYFERKNYQLKIIKILSNYKMMLNK